jgi:hypothetical protein
VAVSSWRAGCPQHFSAKDWTLMKEPSLLHSDVKDVGLKGYRYFQLFKG